MKKVNRFFKSHAIPERLSITPETMTNLLMYNSGVLGFYTDQQHLLAQSLIFTDEIYPIFPKHIIEQLALSLYMQAKGPVYEAREEVFHY